MTDRRIPARQYLVLVLFLLGVVGTGSLMGLWFTPGEWYQRLIKPSFTPPGWVFGPVWTTLYVMIALSGWRTWRREGFGVAMRLWFVQMGLNFAWSPVFFGLHMLGLALAVEVAILAATVGFVVLSWREDSISAGLFIPYVAWLVFAGMLNAAIMVVNS